VRKLSLFLLVAFCATLASSESSSTSPMQTQASAVNLFVSAVAELLER
jgi:hypothetical protein